jgi:hypothetical protein
VLRLNREIETVASAADERLGAVEQVLGVSQDGPSVGASVDNVRNDELDGKKTSRFSY